MKRNNPIFLQIILGTLLIVVGLIGASEALAQSCRTLYTGRTHVGFFNGQPHSLFSRINLPAACPNPSIILQAVEGSTLCGNGAGPTVCPNVPHSASQDVHAYVGGVGSNYVDVLLSGHNGVWVGATSPAFGIDYQITCGPAYDLPTCGATNIAAGLTTVRYANGQPHSGLGNITLPSGCNPNSIVLTSYTDSVLCSNEAGSAPGVCYNNPQSTSMDIFAYPSYVSRPQALLSGESMAWVGASSPAFRIAYQAKCRGTLPAGQSDPLITGRAIVRYRNGQTNSDITTVNVPTGCRQPVVTVQSANDSIACANASYTSRGTCPAVPSSTSEDIHARVAGVSATSFGVHLSAISPVWTGNAAGNNYGVYYSIACTGGLVVPECSDSIDNDVDGKIDFGADPGCSSPDDDSEKNPDGPQCDNGKDDDGDGKIDYRTDGAGDPGCDSPSDDDERDRIPQCRDSIDNDLDGKIDFRADGSGDPGCSSSEDDSEKNPNGPECDNGIDDDGDSKIDFRVDGAGDPGCDSPTDDDEEDRVPQCRDSLDNDADGKIDFRANGTGDPGCSSPEDDSEKNPNGPECDDGVDNDGDGKIDFRVDGNGDTQCTGPEDDDESGATPTPTATATGTVVATATATAIATATATPVPQCSDSRDNDSDTFIDLNDPGCSGPDDNDETDRPSTLFPAVDCVFDNQDGTFTAVFGYQNSGAAVVSIPVGTSTQGINGFSPGEVNRGQPTSFKTGRVRGAFTVRFNGNALSWTLSTTQSMDGAVTATRSSPACAPITPTASCLNFRPDGNYEAVFGYRNANEFALPIGIGALNQFVPAPADRGQPKEFLSGTFETVVTAIFGANETLSWNIGANAVSVNKNFKPLCPASNGCTDIPLRNTKTTLDAVALELSQIAEDSAQRLAELGRKDRRVVEDAQRSQRKADALLAEAQSYIFTMVDLAKSCPLAPKACEQVSYTATKAGLLRVYNTLRRQIARTSARGTFRQTGTTKRTSGQLRARELVKQGTTALQTVPDIQTFCTN